MIKTKRMIWLLTAFIVLSSVYTFGSFAATSGEVLADDWKVLYGDWTYTDGVFELKGGTGALNDAVCGLLFTKAENVRNFTMEYEVYIPDGLPDEYENNVLFRVQDIQNPWSQSLIVSAGKYGYFSNDTVKWSNKTFCALPATDTWAYNVWRKVKFEAKDNQIVLTSKGEEDITVTANVNTKDSAIDTKLSKGAVVIGVSGIDPKYIAKGFTKFKNIILTIDGTIYKYVGKDYKPDQPSASASSAPTPASSISTVSQTDPGTVASQPDNTTESEAPAESESADTVSEPDQSQLPPVVINGGTVSATELMMMIGLTSGSTLVLVLIIALILIKAKVISVGKKDSEPSDSNSGV